MARKSNKTAHVLNLLAGNEMKKEEAEESKETTNVEPEPETKAEENPPVSPAPSVAVIDTTEADPVADLIQNKLMEEFGELPLEENTNASLEASIEESPDEPILAQPEMPPAPAPPEMTPEAVFSQPEPPSEAPVQPAVEPAPIPAQPETPPESVSSESEPDYVFVNVMERIVRDKIIYFMRQFNVCTCDRCKEDTIALALNGILPKYQVMDRHAVDPLLSFYTNRYISDVTVEATKACMEVKEHPRH